MEYLYKNIALIDSSILDYGLFYDNLNSDTFGILYNNNTSPDDILNILQSTFPNGKIDRLCLITR